MSGLESQVLCESWVGAPFRQEEGAAYTYVKAGWDFLSVRKGGGVVQRVGAPFRQEGGRRDQAGGTCVCRCTDAQCVLVGQR